jgi:transcriptional regulator with XRE-family HTH domain
VTDDPTPTTLRRQLGARLRQLRQERGETAQDVATALGVSVSKVSRMESGARAVNEQDLAALVDHYGVDQSAALELAQIARGAKQRRRASAYVATPEGDLNRIVSSGFVELERDADFVREFNSGMIPGLLQTRSYMKTLMLAAAPEDQETLGRAVDLRIERQRRLNQSGRYSAIIDEAALARVVDSPATMREQIEHIIYRMDKGSADVRMIPFTSGPHPGLNSVFVSLTMEATGAPDVVFIEGLVGFQKFDDVEEVRRFDGVWQRLQAIAANSAETRRVLLRYRDSYGSRDERSL